MLPIAHYFTTYNNSGLQIVGDYTLQDNSKGCVVLQHGIGGYRGQPYIQAIRLACLSAGFSVVQFDNTHSFGASEGDLEHYTAYTAYADLCCVIKWLKEQPFAPKKLLLAGMSMGGLCVGHYTEENPEDVYGLMLLSPVVSGKLFHANKEETDPIEWEKHKKERFKNKQHKFNNKISGKTNFAVWDSILDFDITKNAENIICSTLLAVGSADSITPTAHAKIMADAIGKNATLHIIDNAPHSISNLAQLEKLHDVIQSWLLSLKKF